MRFTDSHRWQGSSARGGARKPLRVGLLIVRLKVPAWVARIVGAVQAGDYAELRPLSSIRSSWSMTAKRYWRGWNCWESKFQLSISMEPCVRADTEAMFFLRPIPDNVNDLPGHRRQHSFDNLDFNFYARGDIRREMPGDSGSP